VGPLPTLDDEQLLAVYADASRPTAERQGAFQLLVERYRRRVFGVCVRVLGSPEDAEDAVQDTFVRLARHAASFRGESKLSTWLYRVARNAATDRVRYEARRPSTPVDDLSRLAEAPVAEDVVAARTTALSIQQALEHLDDDTRTMVLLVSVDGWSYQQVADAMDLPVGTVKSRVSRARVRLGELLRDPDDDDPSVVASRDDGPRTTDHTASGEPRAPPP
jgi:RNA polymerase sigma-70 factor (ECF subfamily)